MDATPEWLQLFNVVSVVLFTLAVGVGAILTTARLIRYRQRDERPPLLLWRDVIARNSLLVPFLAILVRRTLEVYGLDTSTFVDDAVWIVPTSSFAVFGAMFYAYFEIFVIERTTKTVSYPPAAKSEHDPEPPASPHP